MVRHLWQSHRWLLLGFLAALALTLFFAGRAAVFAVYWSQHRDEAIAAALGLSPEEGEGRRLTLAEIAADRGVSVETLAAEIEAVIATHRAGQ
jgi:hypothetical protein